MGRNGMLGWICALLLAGSAWTQEMLVSAEWLAAHLKDPELVILHVGSQKDYDAGHIPGARLVTLGDISVTGEKDLRLELPRVEALRDAFGKLGVGEDSRVVIYHGTPAVQSATRVWFALDYLGMERNAALLDGGLALWTQQGRPLSTERPPTANSTFTARPRPSRVVSADWVRTRLHDPAVALIDARTPNFYSGADKGMMPRAGHIPGATNVPYPTFFREDGTLKPRDELRRMLKAGDSPREPLRVTYCHIGQQATVPYFVSRYLGLDVRLFDGSYQEWSNTPSLPVETDSAGANK